MNRETRAAALAAMSDDQGLDVLVVGGGVTGAGIALDAVTRGLRTGIVEMQDWSSGTSSRSSKLVHGGLRYLYNLDVALVAEALTERGRLLGTIAPHLVTPQSFLWPLKTPVVERSYSAVGVGLYEAMAMIGARGATVPLHRHYSRDQARELFPDIRPDQLTGAIRFHDARVDDSRLVVALVRTAAHYGAYAAARTQVVDFVQGPDGRVTGAEIVDLETGVRHVVRASRVINATGIWTEDTEALAETPNATLEVLTSKGIHLTFPKDRIKGDTGLFLRTEKSVLFVIPWPTHWVVGTTDTEWREGLMHPVATAEDIDYVLGLANQVLSSNLTRADVLATQAGLRPLVQPSEGTASTKVSREHTVAEIAPGLIVIAGGKLTTYRAMAEDAVDFALGEKVAGHVPSITATTPLLGASGLEAATRQLGREAGEFGWEKERVAHLLGRYGSEISDLLRLVRENPEWAEPLPHAEAYLKVEAAFAVLAEGALHLEDIVLHRIRLCLEQGDGGVAALPGIIEIVGPLLGWDPATAEAERQAYLDRLEAESAAALETSDAEAESVRLRAPDLVPVHGSGKLEHTTHE